MKNVYLIKSISYHLTDLLIKDIIKDNNNVTTISLMNTSIYDCIDDASYYGLFSDPRVIILKDVKYFGGKFNYEEESTAIKNFISNISDDLTIIFICDSILKTKDLTKYFISGGATIIDKSELLDDDINNLISDYSKSLNVSVDAKAKLLLLKNANNDIDVVLSEIEKISNVSNNITEDLVKEYGSIVNSDETFNFIDAVVQKNFNSMFNLLDNLISNGSEVLGLISLLANRYSTMYIVKSADIDRVSDEEIAKLLNYKNPKRLYYVRKEAKIYTLDQLKEIIINLSTLDKKIKTGLSPVYGLKELLLNL
jgi:DNA polymerase III delta subunit